jgi:hypothetical protein
MLFDMEDYLRAGVIGQNQTPITSQTWEDIGGSSRETRDAFFKAVEKWYIAANLAPEGTCKVTPQSLYAEYLTKKDIFIITQNAVWNKLGEPDINGQLGRAEYDNYVSELKDLMKTVKKLFIVLEGGKLKKI